MSDETLTQYSRGNERAFNFDRAWISRSFRRISYLSIPSSFSFYLFFLVKSCDKKKRGSVGLISAAEWSHSVFLTGDLTWLGGWRSILDLEVFFGWSSKRCQPRQAGEKRTEKLGESTRAFLWVNFDCFLSSTSLSRPYIFILYSSVFKVAILSFIQKLKILWKLVFQLFHGTDICLWQVKWVVNVLLFFCFPSLWTMVLYLGDPTAVHQRFNLLPILWANKGSLILSHCPTFPVFTFFLRAQCKVCLLYITKIPFAVHQIIHDTVFSRFFWATKP